MAKELIEKNPQAAESKMAAEVDKKQIIELLETRAALLNILEDEVEAREKLERAYKELAVLGRVRTFSLILFMDVLDPLLRMCNRETIKKVKEQVRDLGGRLPLAKGLRIGGDGSVTLDEVSVSEALAGKAHEEAVGVITSAFSEIMDACTPLIRADLGDEKATETASKAFSSLLERPELVAYKSDLMRIAPEGVEVPREYILLEPGHSYLVEGRTSDKAFEMFAGMVRLGSPCLCISTSFPADVKKEHELAGRATVFWLSKAERDYSISPSSLGILRDRISTFVSQNENAVVLLDGLEYLISMNGFDLTLKFLHDVRETITLNRSRLIVPVSPATLEAKQLALLERHVEPIEIIEEE